MCIYIYIYVYTHASTCVHIYIYIYVYRVRERVLYINGETSAGIQETAVPEGRARNSTNAGWRNDERVVTSVPGMFNVLLHMPTWCICVVVCIDAYHAYSDIINVSPLACTPITGYITFTSVHAHVHLSLPPWFENGTHTIASRAFVDTPLTFRRWLNPDRPPLHFGSAMISPNCCCRAQ